MRDGIPFTQPQTYENITSPGCNSILKTRMPIWDRGIARWWYKFVWLMDEKGLVVKWMVDGAGRSALMSPIPLMICSSSGLAGSNLSVTGHVNVWQQLLIALKPSWTCSKDKESFCKCRRSFGLCIPWLQPLQLFPVGLGQTPSLKSQAPVHWWLQDSGWRYQCGNTGQIHLHNSSNHQEVVEGIFSCGWWKFSALFEIHVDVE